LALSGGHRRGDEFAEHGEGLVVVVESDAVACVCESFELNQRRIEIRHDVSAVFDRAYRVIFAREYQRRAPDLVELIEEVHRVPDAPEFVQRNRRELAEDGVGRSFTDGLTNGRASQRR